ncbi:hypothetical protein WQ54_01965 [Bacillus sp. SA1-12]|nr:hypothetical protein WQ54_01965 [Bacillus sp. SA1-12]
MLVLCLSIFIASILFILILNKELHPTEIVLYWMINAMINEEFLLIFIINLKMMHMANNLSSVFTVIIGTIYLMPMLTLSFLLYFIKFQSIISRFFLILVSLFIHSSCIYISERIGLLTNVQWEYSYTLFYWGAALLVNVMLLLGYRRLLRRAGIFNESYNTAKKLR